MDTNLLKSLLGTAVLGMCILASSHASADTLRDDRRLGDSYGSASRQGPRDPFTDGANANGKRDPFTDGARSATGKRDPFVDGAHGAASALACGLDVAGLDRSGVSAPPAHA
jgi:hypothetical protein